MFTTTAASSVLDLLCTLFTRPGDAVFVEEPSYFLALSIFADHGLQVLSLAMDENGLQMDGVEELRLAQNTTPRKAASLFGSAYLGLMP